MMVPPQERVVAFPHLVEFDALFRREFSRDLAMHIPECVADAAGRVLSDGLELSGSLVDNRRNFG